MRAKVIITFVIPTHKLIFIEMLFGMNWKVSSSQFRVGFHEVEVSKIKATAEPLAFRTEAKNKAFKLLKRSKKDISHISIDLEVGLETLWIKNLR